MFESSEQSSYYKHLPTELTDKALAPLEASLQPRVTLPRSWIFAFAAVCLIYILSCGAPRLLDQIDGQYGGAAREMIARNDWLTPTQDGVPRLQKPPLVYWSEILSIRTFGTNEFGARLPIALVTISWFFGTALLARRVLGSDQAGFAAAMLLSTFMGTFLFTRLIMPEAFVACFLVLTFWCLVEALQESLYSRLDTWLLAAWLFISLGVLAKGLHALLIPVVAGGFCALLRPDSRALWLRFILLKRGWILFLLLVTPWYAFMEHKYPGFLSDQLFNEQVGNMLQRRWPPDSDHVNLVVFWLEHLILFFPATLFFPVAIATSRNQLEADNQIGRHSRNLRQSWTEWENRLGPESLLILFWFVINAAGITFSNVQDYYTMISWPPVAIWLAWAITRQRDGRIFQLPGAFLSLVGVLGIGGVVLLTRYLDAQFTGTHAATLESGDNFVNVLRDLPESAWLHLKPVLFLYASLSVLAGFFLLVSSRCKTIVPGLTVLVVLMGITFALTAQGFSIVQDYFSSERMARYILENADSKALIVCSGDSNQNTSLFFYLPKTIDWVDANPEMEFATRALGIGREHYLSREQVARQWRTDKEVFLIIEQASLTAWKSELLPYGGVLTPVARSGTRVVLCNRN